MRKIDFIALHCSDSDHEHHNNADTIDEWHKIRGWSQIGYNFFIRSNGTIEVGRPVDLIPAHIRGHNKNSVAICLHGKNHFTDKQFRSCAKLCNLLMKVFNLSQLDIIAHNNLDKNKSCPNFEISKVTSLLDDVRESF